MEPNAIDVTHDDTRIFDHVPPLEIPVCNSHGRYTAAFDEQRAHGSRLLWHHLDSARHGFNGPMAYFRYCNCFGKIAGTTDYNDEVGRRRKSHTKRVAVLAQPLSAENDIQHRRKFAVSTAVALTPQNDRRPITKSF